MKRKTRIFIDMDGTLCEWKDDTPFEKLFERGYFINLNPYKNMLWAVEMLCSIEEIEVFILSAYLENTQTALIEKQLWLDKYLGNAIDDEHRIFVPTTVSKTQAVLGGIRNDDILVDDYSLNLIRWQESGGKGIKVLNGVNGKSVKWTKDRVSVSQFGSEICKNIIRVALGV